MNTQKLLFTLTICILTFFTSCEKDCDCNPDALKDMVSEYDVLKDIININTTNFATGFQTVFSGNTSSILSLNDSTEHAQFCQKVITPSRFLNNDNGYFFVESNNAWMVAHATKPELIGTYRYNTVDAKGTYYVKDMVDIIKYKGYGFVNYYFDFPESDVPTQKVAFVKAIPAAGFFIGSGFYESSNYYYTRNSASLIIVENAVAAMAKGLGAGMEPYTDSLDKVSLCRSFIDHIRFFDDQSGYFFIYDYNCYNIAHGTQKDLQGENLYNYQDSRGNYVIRDLARIVKQDGYGYYEYWWNNPVTGLEESKIAMVYAIPGINYFIGSGIYLN